MSDLLAEIGSPGGDGSVVKVAPVDAVALEERAAELMARSLKREAKLHALYLSVRCMDYTTLEGADSPGKVAALCQRARQPDAADPDVPPVAAVCVYPALVADAVSHLTGSSVKVASVAGAFPSGQSALEVRLADIRAAVADGAHEIDIVLSRGAFLAGRYRQCFEEIAASKQACGPAHLKTILETGELGSYDVVRKASMLAMAAGSDFIKTSTGKIGASATHPVALCMAEAIRDFHRQTGARVGLKVAGGIRTAKQAWQYLVIVQETLGPEWLTAERFRIGASSLLTDVLLQIRKERTGRYQSPDYFSVE